MAVAELPAVGAQAGAVAAPWVALVAVLCTPARVVAAARAARARAARMAVLTSRLAPTRVRVVAAPGAARVAVLVMGGCTPARVGPPAPRRARAQRATPSSYGVPSTPCTML